MQSVILKLLKQPSTCFYNCVTSGNPGGGLELNNWPPLERPTKCGQGSLVSLDPRNVDKVHLSVSAYLFISHMAASSQPHLPVPICLPAMIAYSAINTSTRTSRLEDVLRDLLESKWFPVKIWNLNETTYLLVISVKSASVGSNIDSSSVWLIFSNICVSKLQPTLPDVIQIFDSNIHALSPPSLTLYKVWLRTPNNISPLFFFIFYN